MRKCNLLGLLGVLILAWSQAGALDVVATSPSMGALVREVAGSEADLTVLARTEISTHCRPSLR